MEMSKCVCDRDSGIKCVCERERERRRKRNSDRVVKLEIGTERDKVRER